VARQRKKNLTLYSQSGILDVEVLVAAGCVDRLVTTYVLRSGGKAGGSAVERALQAGTLEIEDYTNFNYNARLVAGLHGFSFMQVFEGVMATDLFRKRTFLGENKYRVIRCPYTGKDVLTVPAANPEVCIVHVQRADQFGNAQYWGSMGSVAAATRDGLKAWMAEWVFGCEDRQAYLNHYSQIYGSDLLDSIKAQPYWSAPANYGSAFTSVWDENGRERSLGLTLEELEQLLQEKGLLYE